MSAPWKTTRGNATYPVFCAWCLPAETIIGYSEAEHSHGICQTCAVRMEHGAASPSLVHAAEALWNLHRRRYGLPEIEWAEISESDRRLAREAASRAVEQLKSMTPDFEQQVRR